MLQNPASMSTRFAPALLFAMLLVLHAQLWLGRGSLGHVAQMQTKLEGLQKKNVLAQRANTQLSAEVSDLKEGLEMVEEKARFELGMVKPNEIYVQFTK
jgi:cell division protein FtsB